jgi:hypothetical protein
MFTYQHLYPPDYQDFLSQKTVPPVLTIQPTEEFEKYKNICNNDQYSVERYMSTLHASGEQIDTKVVEEMWSHSEWMCNYIERFGAEEDRCIRENQNNFNKLEDEYIELWKNKIKSNEHKRYCDNIEMKLFDAIDMIRIANEREFEREFLATQNERKKLYNKWDRNRKLAESAIFFDM